MNESKALADRIERERRSIRPLDVTVLSGGPGAEREVSLTSGQAVLKALVGLEHRATICDISPKDLSALNRPADFVFIALHGEFGEDGAVQEELEKRGIPYSGSGVEASRLAMNKVQSKRRFIQAGIPTPRYHLVNQQNLADVDGWLMVPGVVKPVASGSSVGVTIGKTAETVHRMVSRLVDTYGEALVEEYIAGAELTVGILGDEALPVCEIRPAREFYDYEAKYEDDNTQYLFDLDLPEELLQYVQSLSLDAHRALGCSVFSRVDWMVAKNTMEPHALEVNTIPGFTSHSLVPKSAARVGIPFDILCQRIIDLSFTEKRVY